MITKHHSGSGVVFALQVVAPYFTSAYTASHNAAPRIPLTHPNNLAGLTVFNVQRVFGDLPVAFRTQQLIMCYPFYSTPVPRTGSTEGTTATNAT